MKQHEFDLDKIVAQIEKSIKAFDSQIPAFEREIFNKLTGFLKELKTTSGRISMVSSNVRMIADIERQMSTIVDNKSYLSNVKEFLTAFDGITTLQNNYFSSMVTKFSAPRVLSSVRNEAVRATAKSLTDQGVNEKVTPGIQSILRRNINEGGSFATMMDEMRTFLVSSKENIGALQRYTQQITTDSLNQYSATYNETISQDLNFVWRMYTGSLIETSRAWCVHMVAKKYVHQSELQTVISDHIDGVNICSGEIPCSKKTGLPSGMIEGTNASNIAQRRGGWQCGHQFGGVSAAVVPKNLRDKFKDAA